MTVLRKLKGLRFVIPLIGALASSYPALAQDPASQPEVLPLAVEGTAALPDNERLEPIDGEGQAAATDSVDIAVENASDTDAEAADPGSGFNPDEYNSLLFTQWERASIADAISAQGTTLARAPTEEEFTKQLKGEVQETAPEDKVKPPPEKRFITLSGIAFRSKTDWTIWLNGARVTPTALPKELMDLKVFKDYIELKWYDDYNNEIYPIRLRTHQRFNIDKRLFMPG